MFPFERTHTRFLECSTYKRIDMSDSFLRFFRSPVSTSIRLFNDRMNMHTYFDDAVPIFQSSYYRMPFRTFQPNQREPSTKRNTKVLYDLWTQQLRSQAHEHLMLRDSILNDALVAHFGSGIGKAREKMETTIASLHTACSTLFSTIILLLMEKKLRRKCTHARPSDSRQQWWISADSSALLTRRCGRRNRRTI